jgi:hypothetical protein
MHTFKFEFAPGDKVTLVGSANQSVFIVESVAFTTMAWYGLKDDRSWYSAIDLKLEG